jgi:hypothetical protein
MSFFETSALRRKNMVNSFVTGNGTNVTISCNQETWRRLSGTSFGRYAGTPFAGTFRRWQYLDDMLRDTSFLARFLDALQTAIGQIQGVSHSQYFTVACNEPIGWSTTAPKSSFRAEDLEEYHPNKRSTCLRVKLASGHLAPLTNLVTFSCNFLKLKDCWNIVVYSAYPGQNFGRLDGDVTERTGLVLYDWGNRGQPLPVVAASDGQPQPQPQPGG